MVKNTVLRLIIALVVMVCHVSPAFAAAEPNIVIESADEVYRISVDKSGRRMGKVRHESNTVYRALRSADNAVAMEYYNDKISIDKSTGGKAVYGSYFPDDVFYSDSKACLMSLPLKEAGSRAKATFVRTFNDPDMFCSVIVAGYYPVERATVTFIIPAALPQIRIECAGVEAGHVSRTEEDKGKERVVTFTFTDLPALVTAPRALSVNSRAPRLMVLGHYDDVQHLYTRLYEYVTRVPDPSPDTVAALAREVTAQCGSDAERIAAITRYVHDNIRYVAIEHGEYAYVPDPPSEVLRKRFGDCKGSAGLLRAMLRSVGVDARYVWVGSCDIPTEWTEAPYMASGNHMIAAAVTGDSLLYIDGTATHFLPGCLPGAIRGRQTIVEDSPNHCIIDRIPEDSPDDNSEYMEFDCFTLKENNSVIGRAVFEFTGYKHFLLHQICDKVSTDKYGDFWLAFIKGLRPDSKSQLEGLPCVTDSLTRVKAVVSHAGAWRTVGDEMYIDINPCPELRDMEFDLVRYAGLPCRLPSKISRKVVMKVSIPKGYEAAGPGEAFHVSNDWIDARLETRLTADTLAMERHMSLTIKSTCIPAAGIAGFNESLRTFARAMSSPVALRKKPIADN